jgi:hypothetical protein
MKKFFVAYECSVFNILPVPDCLQMSLSACKHQEAKRMQFTSNGFSSYTFPKCSKLVSNSKFNTWLKECKTK